ncbi:MAG: PspC domain-containing protein [Bacteroidales bacterium]|nr:PspC domain-containing protein [Bacteroidales bacterium]
MEDNSNYRRLMRSTTDRRIAGVCGGLAKYLNVDPTVIRIVFLIALICGSLGFWAYLIIWIAAPEDNRIENK